MTDERKVLYRCKTPTNFLCPCGGVARDLKRRGLEFEEVRVPFSKNDRADIAELTKQNRVPVLVDGDEIVNDSKRIHQWLEHTYGEI